MTVLFICSGNVFRSMVAEYALRSALTPGASAVVVGSAGIEARPQPVHPWVSERMREHGIDVTPHRQRKLDAHLLAAELAVAMGTDHRAFVATQFGKRLPLFNELCWDRDEGIPDIWEAVPDYATNVEAARRYGLSVIDHIVTSVARLAKQLNS